MENKNRYCRKLSPEEYEKRYTTELPKFKLYCVSTFGDEKGLIIYNVYTYILKFYGFDNRTKKIESCY